jgi:hypothetical protein
MILVIEIVMIIVPVLIISGSHDGNIYYSDCDKLMIVLVVVVGSLL